jgi:hypothetical protein
MPRTITLKRDSYNPVGEYRVEFRLLYDGELLGAGRNDTRSEHKHEIRRQIHRQLKELWQVSRQLRQWMTLSIGELKVSVLENIANHYRLGNYRLAPLVSRDLELGCSLDILFLRYDQPGLTLLQSGDLDNRLKTIFDALRMPKVGEFYGEPGEGEDPLFCLLEDDSMITHVSLTTDVLLEPNRAKNDVRLIITVKLWPLNVTIANIGFG